MKKAILVAQGGTAIAALALITAMAQADSVRHSDISTLELDMATAATAAMGFFTGDIAEAELDVNGNHVIWEIDIVNDADEVITVEVDGQTGHILSIDYDDDSELKHADAIKLARAIEVVKAVETGALVEAELEYENGALIWEVETISNSNAETKYRIHAETGEILI